jgi:hypothetical protein
MGQMTHMKLVFRTCCGAPGGFRLHATRKAAIQGWQLSESLRGLLITLCHIRYSPIGASSKQNRGTLTRSYQPQALREEVKGVDDDESFNR